MQQEKLALPTPPARPQFPAVDSLGRFSAAMCILVAIGGALGELALAWVWLSPGMVEALVASRLGLAAGVASVDAPARIAGFLVSMLPMGVLLYALGQAYKLFDAFRLGEVIGHAAPVRLRRIGLAMVALAVLAPLTRTLLGLVLTAAAPPGQHMLIVSLSLDDYMVGIFGGLVLAIAQAMLEAARIADEHRQIV